jgi:tetratricopeptide (TPR) repeat protein
MPPWLAVLGRDSQYPQSALRLPNLEEVRGIVRRVLEESSTRSEEELRKHPMLPNAAIAEWVFLNNRNEHPFFVEESHALTWSYPFAVPHGLIYRLNAEPLEQLPPEVVDADMKFWEATLERLSMDARFAKDVTAPRVYSKLRQTTGNLYRFRKRWGVAETAYRQALKLWPTNPEAVIALGDLLRQQGRGEEARQVVLHALKQDPLSEDLRRIESLLRADPER